MTTKPCKTCRYFVTASNYPPLVACRYDSLTRNRNQQGLYVGMVNSRVMVFMASHCSTSPSCEQYMEQVKVKPPVKVVLRPESLQDWKDARRKCKG